MGKNCFKKDLLALPPRLFFMFILFVSNHTSFNLDLISTRDLFKKLKLHSLKRISTISVKNSQVQIVSKLNDKNRMISYTSRYTKLHISTY